nr:retrovirus-related Pol polyprotein from transposon TNT 1-94 [Tanacetum cinerariifolium]
RRTQKKAKETELEDHLRTVKSSLNKASVVESTATSSVIKSVSIVNSNLKCASCNGCLFSDNYDACVVAYINSMNASKKTKSVKTSVKRKVWKSTGKVFKTVGYIWKPTGRTFTLVGNVYPLTRIATATIVPPREPILIVKSTDKPVVTLHMTGDRSQLINFVQKFLSMVKFRNDHVAKIMGYGDYQIRNVIISRVYYVEGLGQGLVRGLLKLKFEKDHLCSACAIGKSTKKTHKPKSKDTNQEKLYLLHMDLYGPMRVESVNGKKYILNGVVERRNRTLIEAARTMLIYTQALLFLWAEAVATACFTQNRSIIRLRHGKTPYELMHGKQPDLSFFHVFGALCYPTNDSENVSKLQPKADIGIFIGYAPSKKAFQIYSRRTRRIVETIHVDFDELTAMASEQSSL